ncbi:MAG: ExeM/NucH family extracellular endonuclease [Pseudoxanthomonas sp.]|nr:ExeM/NucH family extracellular endonuclease [Pseudoxanthomonas sp.]
MSVPRLTLLLAILLAHALALPASARSNAVVPIGSLQAGSDARPAAGQAATVEGVVSADFSEGLGGFFVQDAGDDDARTSDALFVMAAGGRVLPPVSAGDRVRVSGVLAGDLPDSRRGALVTLLADAVQKTGRGDLSPLRLTEAPADWQPLLGMRVQIDAPLTLNSTDARFAETIASFDGRLWTPTELAAPGTDAIRQVETGNARRRLVLDDASNRRDPGPAWYLPGAAPRGGSVATGAQGIVDQRHGSVRLQLTEPLPITPAARPPAPQVDGRLKVAVFNVENLFNGDGMGGGFPTRRGAKSPEQLQAQTDKLVQTVRALDPDIVALMELENDGYGPRSSLAQFVDALNTGEDEAPVAAVFAKLADAPNKIGGHWRFVDAGQGPGRDDIRVGLIYRADQVSALGKPAVLEGGPFSGRSRVPLAQAFKRGDGPAFVVVANHFKSKGCSEAEGANLDQGDGQGCWNALRTESAQRLHAWLKQDPTGQRSALKLIAGDLNAYAMEDPLRALRDAGWRDAFAVAEARTMRALRDDGGVDAAAVAREKKPYSFVFNGQAGRLDYALLSPALARRLKGARKWHSNADEPDSAGYAQDNVPGPWRSSDHAPILLGFDL